MAENNSQRRRRVLQNLGIGSVTTLSSIPVVGAARNDQGRDLVGISYDTLTHETGEVVTGQIPAQNNSGGSIEVAGFNIPLRKLEQESAKTDRMGSRYTGVLYDEEFISRDSRSGRKIPLKVRIDQKASYVSGMLSRPSGEFGRLGFYLIEPNVLKNGQGLSNPTTAPEWEDHPLNFKVPSEGLPTDSSPAHISEYTKSWRKSDRREKEIEHEKTETISTSGDSGVITEYSHESTLEGTCENTNYQVNFGVLADNKMEHEYDEIGEHESNFWRFYVYFGNRPDDMFDCDSINHIQPSNYSLHVEPFYEDQRDYIHFSHPEPSDEDGQNENDELGLALDILRSSTGNIASIGASVAEYVMAGSGSSTMVDYDYGGVEYNFDVDLDGTYDDLPRELSDEGKTTQFSLRLNNNWPSDEKMCSIEFQPEYTFHYADSTSCTCFDATTVGMYKTVTPDWTKAPEAWYNSVDT